MARELVVPWSRERMKDMGSACFPVSIRNRGRLSRTRHSHPFPTAILIEAHMLAGSARCPRFSVIAAGNTLTKGWPRGDPAPLPPQISGGKGWKRAEISGKRLTIVEKMRFVNRHDDTRQGSNSHIEATCSPGGRSVARRVADFLPR